LLGSCRYPGSPFERKYSNDASFAAMLNRVANDQKQPAPPSAILMLGDQIYGDATADVFDTRVEVGFYADRYQQAFETTNFTKLVSQCPTYMVPDDHEVLDDYEPTRETGLFSVPLSYAVWAYERYQWSHGPRTGLDAREATHFICSGFPVYLMDTRFDRIQRGGWLGGGEKIVSDGEMSKLKQWLLESQKAVGNRPKFVAFGSMLLPIEYFGARDVGVPRRTDDSWFGHQQSFKELLTFLLSYEIGNVVFLSGDPHMSSASELTIAQKGGGSINATCIVSSPLYCPLPFTIRHKEDYLLGTNPASDPRLTHPAPIPLAEDIVLDYTTRCVAMGDGFADLQVKATEGNNWSLHVDFVSTSGKSIGTFATTL
jgi:hypothetical protein